jgi:hypothetical protein
MLLEFCQVWHFSQHHLEFEVSFWQKVGSTRQVFNSFVTFLVVKDFIFVPASSDEVYMIIGLGLEQFTPPTVQEHKIILFLFLPIMVKISED